jgi:hypothetical protein
MRKVLIRQDKSKIWSHEALEIYFTWCQGIKERMRQVVYGIDQKDLPPEQVLGLIKEMIELTKLTNQHLHQIKLSYGSAVHYIKLTQDPMSQWALLDRYIYPVNAKMFSKMPKVTMDNISIMNKNALVTFY